MDPSKGKKKEYLVQVQIVEIRQISGKDGGTADPFVKITVGNLPPQVTSTKEKTTTAVFNQNFTFSGLKMNEIDFENFEIKIEVFDQKQFMSNNYVGGHSVGLSTLYRNPNHEVHNEWLTLFHPSEDLKPQGHLLASIYIIGDGDRPPIHDVNDNKVEDEPDEFGGVPDDQLNAEQLQKRREDKKKVAFVLAPSLQSRSFQLMVNIIKGEDFPIMTGDSCDAFVSVRANGLTQRTATFKNQSKPQFKTRLLFPLQFPLNNDKIVIRIWDKRVCLSDTFIAQVPENPTENDFFNINYLQSRGGTLPYQWFNLYSIPMNERPSDFESKYLGYKKSAKGTSYMGKLLLSLNLTPSEKPEKGVVSQGMYREPPLAIYAIRLDAYEIGEAKNCGEYVIIRVRVGGQFADTKKAYPQMAHTKKGQPKQKLKQTEAQTYVWHDKEIMCDLKTFDMCVDPQQHPDIIVELYNEQKERVSYLRLPANSPDLMENKPKWYHLKEVKYKGSDDMPEPTHSYALLNIMLRKEEFIAGLPRIPIKRTAKSPQYFTCFFYAGYDLCSDLYQDEIMSTFTIKFNDFEYVLDKPFISKNPIWNLKISAPIYLDDNLEFASNIVITITNTHPSQMNRMFGDNKIGEICLQAFYVGSDKEYDPEDPIKPNWTYYHVIKGGRSNGRILASFHSQRMQKSAKKITYNEVTPSYIVKDWVPTRIQIPVYAIRKLPQKLKQSQIHARIPRPASEVKNIIKPLAPVVQKDNEEIEEVIAENPYYNYKMIKSQLPGGEQETKNSSGFLDPNFQQMIELEFLMPPEMILTPQLEIEIRSPSQSNPRYTTIIPLLMFMKKDQEQKNASYFYLKTLEFKSSDQELQNQIEMRSGKQDADQEKDENSDHEQKEKVEEVPLISTKSTQSQSMMIDHDLKMKGIVNVSVDDSFMIKVEQKDKDYESDASDWKVLQLKLLLGCIPKTAQGSEMAISTIKREMQSILAYKVEENKFLGLEVPDDDGDEVFDYGREVVKGPYEDILSKTLPYKKFHIYKLSSGGQLELTHGCLKANIKILKTSSENPSQPKVSFITQNKEKNYPFSFFDPIFLDYFGQQLFQVKLRVYVYRCLSLAAQAQDIEIKQAMAGFDAICSANAFIEIQVGDGDTTELVKRVSDVERYVPNTLSPTFLRIFELDAELPIDWNLEFRVMNKGTLLNNIIGQIDIDLEDRLLGEPKLQERLAFMIYKDYYEKKVMELKHDYSKEADHQKSTLQSEITNLTQMIDSFDRDFKIPVEYKELKNTSKSSTSQGTVEMFVECLPFDISRMIPPQPLAEPTVMDYEVRLVILETNNIVIPEGKSLLSIMVEARMDASATGTSKEETFETDCHNGSKDGYGVFNWRMKFNFRTPCQFPRMKVTVYDFSPFGTNENIGDATISLKRVLSTLRTQSKYDMPPTSIQISHPNFPGQERGSILLQLSILQKTAAEGNPVGQAREEPNIDPFLPTPKEGRGIGDFLKFSFIPWGFIINMVLRILIPAVISGLIGFICFIKPGILLPKK